MQYTAIFDHVNADGLMTAYLSKPLYCSLPFIKKIIRALLAISPALDGFLKIHMVYVLELL